MDLHIDSCKYEYYFFFERNEKENILLHTQITIIDALKDLALRQAHVMRKKEMFAIVVRCMTEDDV